LGLHYSNYTAFIIFTKKIAMSVIILGIESSCDDTSAAIIKDGRILSNCIANQDIHLKYGGVVPELASRAHQQNIIPVVDQALMQAGISKTEINAVAFTRGPGLLGSLLVGTSFSKGLAMSLNIPLIEINHLQAHILVHFIQNDANIYPTFPFLCLLVSGGHTMIVKVSDYLNMEIIGSTIDDAAGEAFDKCAKIMDLPYPGGPHVDKLAKTGNIHAFSFSKPVVGEFEFSFSGLKTNFLYFIKDQIKQNPDFIKENLNDLCASVQHTIVEILTAKLEKAAKKLHIDTIAIAGGVSANSYLKQKTVEIATKNNWRAFIPEFKYTTDNAAMVAITAYYKYLNNDFVYHDISATARYSI
jgi:N6-L-threonylcarbamoyladenine synthase